MRPLKLKLLSCMIAGGLSLGAVNIASASPDTTAAIMALIKDVQLGFNAVVRSGQQVLVQVQKIATSVMPDMQKSIPSLQAYITQQGIVDQEKNAAQSALAEKMATGPLSDKDRNMFSQQVLPGLMAKHNADKAAGNNTNVIQYTMPWANSSTLTAPDMYNSEQQDDVYHMIDAFRSNELNSNVQITPQMIIDATKHNDSNAQAVIAYGVGSQIRQSVANNALLDVATSRMPFQVGPGQYASEKSLQHQINQLTNNSTYIKNLLHTSIFGYIAMAVTSMSNQVQQISHMVSNLQNIELEGAAMLQAQNVSNNLMAQQALVRQYQYNAGSDSTQPDDNTPSSSSDSSDSQDDSGDQDDNDDKKMPKKARDQYNKEKEAMENADK